MKKDNENNDQILLSCDPLKEKNYKKQNLEIDKDKIKNQ